MADTPTISIIRNLVVYTLHIFDEEYIPYNIPSSCNKYGSLISSEENNVYNYDPAMNFTPPDDVFFHKCTTNHHPGAYFHYFTLHPQKLLIEK